MPSGNYFSVIMYQILSTIYSTFPISGSWRRKYFFVTPHIWTPCNLFPGDGGGDLRGLREETNNPSPPPLFPTRGSYKCWVSTKRVKIVPCKPHVARDMNAIYCVRNISCVCFFLLFSPCFFIFWECSILKLGDTACRSASCMQLMISIKAGAGNTYPVRAYRHQSAWQQPIFLHWYKLAVKLQLK